VRVYTITVCRSKRGYMATCNGQTASVSQSPFGSRHHSAGESDLPHPGRAALAVAEQLYPRTPHVVRRINNFRYALEVSQSPFGAGPPIPHEPTACVPSPSEPQP
jgi:hypothetical protein